jgi:hypothetical protein
LCSFSRTFAYGLEDRVEYFELNGPGDVDAVLREDGDRALRVGSE